MSLSERNKPASDYLFWRAQNGAGAVGRLRVDRDGRQRTDSGDYGVGGRHSFPVTHKITGEVRLTFGSAAELEFLVQTFGAGGVDPMSATMALVEALAADDRPAIQRAARDVSSLSPGELVQSLGKFGMLFAKGFTPEHRQVIRAELAAAGSDRVQG